MAVLSYTDLKKNLSKHLNHVVESNKALVTTCEIGKKIVLISLNEYNSLLETMYLQSNWVNAKRLQEAVDEMNSH